MSHRVTVVVRTKDRPDFLVRALSDIAAQSFTDAAVVVVNDGGLRAEVERVVLASALTERVSIVDSAAPGGRCAAANTGIAASESEYVVLHDDDDLWHPDFLSRTVAYLDSHPDDAGVVVPTEIVYERRVAGEWVEYDRVPFWNGMTAVSFMALLEVNRMVPISVLYRRDVHDTVGPYDEALETVEDWDFYLRIAARFALGFLPGDVLAYWTQRPAGTGSSANSMFELAGAHVRDDAAVRDRELRKWVATQGLGLPLYLAQMERQIRERLVHEMTIQLDRQRREIVDEIYARHPVWRRLRRLFGR